MYSNPGTQLGAQNKDVTRGFSFVYHAGLTRVNSLYYGHPNLTVSWCPFTETVLDGAAHDMSLETSVI